MPMWPRSADGPRAPARAALLGLALGALLGGCAVPPQGPDRAPVPPGAQVSYERALASMQADHPKEATARFESMTHKYPGLSGPYINLGILYMQSGDLDKAQAALQQAVHCKPERAAAYNQLGIVYRKQGKFAKAKQAYLQALRIDPQYEDAQLNLGILYDLYFNDLEQALAYYQRYQRTNGGDDPQVARWIADLKLRGAPKLARHDAGGQP